MMAFAAAIQCLKRKKLYEVQVEQLGNFQLRIHDQVGKLSFVIPFHVFELGLDGTNLWNSAL